MFKIIQENIETNNFNNKVGNIPNNFNWKLYISLLKNPKVDTIHIAYAHFLKFCKNLLKT